MNVYFQTKCARETRNEYCESSRATFTRQLRDWVPQDTNMATYGDGLLTAQNVCSKLDLK